MGRRGQAAKKTADAHKARLQEALSFLDQQAARADIHPYDQYSIAAVARNFDVKYDTLRRRFHTNTYLSALC
jgi:transcriptional regulator GlxA family with amidase domain